MICCKQVTAIFRVVSAAAGAGLQE